MKIIYNPIENTFDYVGESDQDIQIIEDRISNLENHYEVYQIFTPVAGATSGNVQKPDRSAILLNRFSLGGQAVDAILVKADNQGRPTDQIAENNLGQAIAVSIDLNGDYTLSSMPVDLVSCLVYYIKITALYANDIDIEQIVDFSDVDDASEVIYDDESSVKDQIDNLKVVSHSHSNKTTLDAITEPFTTQLKATYDGVVGNAHAHANKSVLDQVSEAFTTALKQAYDAAVANAHAHANKTTLDLVTEAFTTALKLAYDGAVTNSHTHANKATLDAITQAFTTALKSSYDNAASLAHTHTNKATLDLVTEAFTTVLKSAYDNAVTNSHTHSNKATLDAITQAFTTALKSSYDNASSLAHSHTNKATLDLITEAFTTALKTSYDNAVALAHAHANKLLLDNLPAPTEANDFLVGSATYWLKKTLLETKVILNIHRYFSYSKNLTDNVFVGVVTIALPNNSSAGCNISFTVHVADATNQQTYTAAVGFAAVNKAGVITATATESVTPVKVLSAGTLTLTWQTVAGTGTVTINVRANSSLTPLSETIEYFLNNNSDKAVTIL